MTLPAGSYTLRFKVYNSTNGSGGSAEVVGADLFGFEADGGTAYYAPNNTFPIGQWCDVAVSFTLDAETAGKISMGFKGTNGNANVAHLFVDNVQILKVDFTEDCTSSVASKSWTGASDGYQSGENVTIESARYYGYDTTGDIIYQTVTGLKNGTYEVAVYANSQQEWEGTIAQSRSDESYVVVQPEGKFYINSYVRKGYPGDEALGIYTISGVQVTNGTLYLAYGIDIAKLCGWHHFQIKSLTRTCKPDLSIAIAAWKTALSSAKTTYAKADKHSATVWASLNTAIETYDEGKVDEEDDAALEAATTALTKATAAAETSIASYAIIASGVVATDKIEGWADTGTGSEFRVNTWSTEGNTDGSGMTTPFIQTWINSSNNTYLKDGQAYYTLAGLEPGEVYYAKALVRAYSEAGNVPNGPNFFINDVVTDMTTEGTSFTNGNSKGIYATLGGAATVGEDGKITLGVTISGANYNWVAFKNVSIQSMDDAFNAAVAKVTALKGTIPAGVYDAAYAVVTANSGDNYPTTANGFETAIAAIEDAATTAAACVEPYAAWKTLKSQADALVAVDNNNTEANGTLSSAITTQETAAEAASTLTALQTVISDLKTAMTTYAGAANPVGDNAKFDLTFMLTNPDLSGFTSWTKVENVPGWSTDQTEQGQNAQVMKNDGVAAEGGKNAFFEYWSENAVANGKFALYNTVKLPEGTYTINCYALATANGVEGATTSQVFFFANDTQGSLVSADKLTEASISFVNTAEQDVKIGLKALAGNEFRWMGIGYVELYKVPAAAAVELNEDVAYVEAETAADVKLTRKIFEGFNTVVLPFSMTATEIETVFGEGTLYKFDDADAGQLQFSTATELQAHTPYLFKANADKTIADETIAGRTITVSTNNLATKGTDYSLVGTYTPYAKGADSNPIVVGYDYILGSDNSFHKTTVKNALKAFRAYIKANESVEEENTVEITPARLVIVLDGETTTSIDAIDGRAVNGAATYNLAGQKVEHAQKGIYIQNGKKVVK